MKVVPNICHFHKLKCYFSRTGLYCMRVVQMKCIWGLLCEVKERPLKSPHGQWGRPAVDIQAEEYPPQRSPWVAVGTMALLQH